MMKLIHLIRLVFFWIVSIWIWGLQTTLRFLHKKWNFMRFFGNFILTNIHSKPRHWRQGIINGWWHHCWIYIHFRWIWAIHGWGGTDIQKRWLKFKNSWNQINLFYEFVFLIFVFKFLIVKIRFKKSKNFVKKFNDVIINLLT